MIKKIPIIIVFLMVYTSAFAQGVCTTTGTPIVTGLTTSPNLGQNLSSLGPCVVDPKAPFTPNKVPTFDDLKSLYYNQAKTSADTSKHPPLVGDKTHSDIPMTAGNNHLYYIKKTSPTSSDGNLAITGNISGGGSQTGVVFVDGNLDIGPIASRKLDYGSNNSGLVFVVGGNVNIDVNITQVDAVIISAGTIYTAGAGCTLPTTAGTDAPLTINGSLISLTDNKPPKFCRKLANNNQPAEKISHQVKYLVILRHILSDTFQRWSEVQ